MKTYRVRVLPFSFEVIADSLEHAEELAPMALWTVAKDGDITAHMEIEEDEG